MCDANHINSAIMVRTSRTARAPELCSSLYGPLSHLSQCMLVYTSTSQAQLTHIIAEGNISGSKQCAVTLSSKCEM